MYEGHSLFGLENSEKLKENRKKTHARAELCKGESFPVLMH